MGSGQLGNQPSDAPLSGGAIEDASLSDAELASNSVITSKIADSNVTTNKIANLNVTTGKLAVGAVTGDKMSVVDEYSVATQYGPFASPTTSGTNTYYQTLSSITVPTSSTGQLTVASSYFELYISYSTGVSGMYATIYINGDPVSERVVQSANNVWTGYKMLGSSVRTNSTTVTVQIKLDVSMGSFGGPYPAGQAYFRNVSFNYSWFN